MQTGGHASPLRSSDGVPAVQGASSMGHLAENVEACLVTLAGGAALSPCSLHRDAGVCWCCCC